MDIGVYDVLDKGWYYYYVSYTSLFVFKILSIFEFS